MFQMILEYDEFCMFQRGVILSGNIFKISLETYSQISISY